MTFARTVIIVGVVGVAMVPALVQSQAPVDSIRLGALQDAAVRHDPRGQQVELLRAQSALRTDNIRTDLLPSFGVTAQGQYQSVVTTIPVRRPDGSPVVSPMHDTYDAALTVRQPLYDPSISVRRASELARLGQSEAQVAATIFAVRQQVLESYFTALRLQLQRDEMITGLRDLEAQRQLAEARVTEGAALPSHVLALQAELLRRRQILAELTANRVAALSILSQVTGQPLDTTNALAIPNLKDQVSAVGADIASVRERPEYTQFDRMRDLLDKQRDELSAINRPRLSAFGKAGYGRPGLNPLNDSFENYWLAGVQLEWSPFNWGRTRRERQAMQIQQDILATEEAAFTESLQLATARDLADLGRLEQTLAADDSLIVLRQHILQEAKAQFSEGVMTSADYLDRETDLLTARIARAQHRVQLAEARARFLTLLGIEVE